MRLWSIHPRYLDSKGLVACWREALLARKVLLGSTQGYRNHPQLDRFRGQVDPVSVIDTYLLALHEEATQRGYRFERKKIGSRMADRKISVTDGQLRYEFSHLQKKLRTRDKRKFDELANIQDPEPHPIFFVVHGEIEAWERLSSEEPRSE